MMTSSHAASKSDFFWQSDALPAEGHTTIWSELSDYLQPPVMHDPWRDQHLGDLDAHTTTLSGGLPNYGAAFEDVDDANAAEVPFYPASDIYLEDLINDLDDVYQDSCGPWSTSTPPLTDSSSLLLPFGDATWAGDIPSPSYMTTGTYGDQIQSGSAAPTNFQPALAWLLEPGQIDNTIIPNFAGDGSLEGQIAPDYGANLFNYTGLGWATSYLPESAPAQLFGPTLDGVIIAGLASATSPSAHVPAVPGTVLGKRPRGAEEPYDDGGPEENDSDVPRPCKKGKAKTEETNGVLKAAEPTSRARHKPATRTPVKLYGKSKTAGRGAGRLAATNAMEVYHQSLPGPSVQQVLVGAPAWEQPAWVEGSVEGGTWQHNSSMVQPEEDEPFRIPEGMEERHWALLAATPDDWGRKTVTALKCRLCPRADFCDWQDFTRHCDTAETHPWKIFFCNDCGDFFARNDSLVRHRRKPHKDDMAQFKRQETERLHEEFKDKLNRCMKTGEELGEPFSNIVKAKFPKSSKKGSKEQSRLPVKRKSRSRKAGH